MENEVKRLANKLWEKYEQAPPSKRILIAISGIPGSGKSTLAHKAAGALNELHEKKKGVSDDAFAVDVPMDGYHYSRAQLAAMPDPATAIHRRGAAFTFDAEGFYSLVQKLHESVNKDGAAILAPSFDHALKDPVADSIAILPSTRIVFLEGCYLSLNRGPWSSAARLMDELWFVEVDREVARKRLIKRHVASGIVVDEEAARHRIRTTDFLNADDILENNLEVHEVIRGDV